MQEINQEALSFLQSYDVNFARTQEEVNNAETELKKFEILFNLQCRLKDDFSLPIAIKKQNYLSKVTALQNLVKVGQNAAVPADHFSLSK